MRSIACLILFLGSLGSAQTRAEEIKIVLWNARTLFNVAGVNTRASDLQDFGQHFAGADIIVLDEVTSLEVVNAARDKMGFLGYHTACSDFNQNNNDTFNSLEVGFISRFPLENVVEFDITPDNTGQAEEPGEQQLQRVDLPGIAMVNPSRGFLTADVPDLGLTLVGTHLKSSGGGEESDNAKKREFVAAAIAKFVANKLGSNSAATVLVAGDMNVGETDKFKNGFHLEVDHDQPGNGDLYDDTHAIFSTGLIEGLHLASLTKGIGSETYDDTDFAGSGPIDCMYIAGRQTSDFTLAKKTPETFGSDHFAVSTRFLFSGTVPPQPDGNNDGGSTDGNIRITELLPDPAGPDGGHEVVKLKNTGTESVSLNGWKLQDKANNSVSLTGSIAPGTTVTIHLADGQMPLNQNGDTIKVLNPSGETVHKVEYTDGQVSPGQSILFNP